MAVEEGNTVKVEYEGKFEDGEVFDSTEKHGGTPLEFKVGEKMVVQGFDKAVVGMEKGEEKEVTIQPLEGYGDVNPELEKKVPKDKIDVGQEVKVGMMLGMTLQTGQQVPAKVTAVDDKEITIDLNHPLAGKVLVFKIKVVDIVSEPEEKKDVPSEESKE